jgi:hypothetical protein
MSGCQVIKVDLFAHKDYNKVTRAIFTPLKGASYRDTGFTEGKSYRSYNP